MTLYYWPQRNGQIRTLLHCIKLYQEGNHTPSNSGNNHLSGDEFHDGAERGPVDRDGTRRTK